MPDARFAFPVFSTVLASLGHANQLREGSDAVSKDFEQATVSAVTEHAPEEKSTPSDVLGGKTSSAEKAPIVPPLPAVPSIQAPPRVASPVVPPAFTRPQPVAVDAAAARPGFTAPSPSFAAASSGDRPALGDKSRFAALLRGARQTRSGSAAPVMSPDESQPEPEVLTERLALSDTEPAAEVPNNDDTDDGVDLGDADQDLGEADGDDGVDLGDSSEPSENAALPSEEYSSATTSFDVDFSESVDRQGGEETSDATINIGTPAPDEAKTGQLTPRRDALFGTVLADRYRVLDLIGKGGMGKVYLAEHVAIGKKVAIKVLSQAYCHRPDQVKRFLREARAASTIDHENVIDITDFGEMPNGSVFFAMEYLQGEDLGKLLRRHGRLSWPRARRIILQICRALQAAHGRGIIHRDVKPENCFLITRGGRRDFVKVLDFGIAKVVDEDRKASHTLTQAGALIGTPEYMAPEQVTGEVADPRMDIYSIGCIMYQLLTGRLPFSDKTMFGVLTQQVNMKPPPLREVAPEADLPEEVEAIVLKAMEKTKEARYQTMLEMVEAIAAAPRGTAGSHGDRAMTMGTSNLAAAAAEARKIAEAHMASQGQAASSVQNAVSPHLTGAHAALSASAVAAAVPTGVGGTGPYPYFGSDSESGTGSWDPAIENSAATATDPKLLFRLAIGLGVIVMVLLLVLLYMLIVPASEEEADSAGEQIAAAELSAGDSQVPALVKGDSEGKATTSSTGTTSGGSSTTAADSSSGGQPVEPIVTPTPTPTPPPQTKKKKKTKSKTPKPDKPSGIVLPNLDLREVSQAMGKVRSDVDRCKNQYGDSGRVKIDVTFSGSTGKVIKAVPVQGNKKVAECVAKAVKRKVRVSRFAKTSASSRRTF